MSEQMDRQSPTRKHRRQKVDIRIRLRRVGPGDAEVFTVRSFEMSEGGMSVYSSEALELGTRLMSEFELPDVKKSLKIECVVRNQRGFRCGLEFVQLEPAVRELIVQFLETLPGVIEI